MCFLLLSELIPGLLIPDTHHLVSDSVGFHLIPNLTQPSIYLRKKQRKRKKKEKKDRKNDKKKQRETKMENIKIKKEEMYETKL